MILYLKYL